jgi:hypothetical protein
MASRIIFSMALLFSLSCARQEFQLQSTSGDEGIEITEGSSPMLFYQIKPKSLNGKFERAGYIHPLYSLGGNIMTEDFPDDHPHHHGIYSAWHQIMINDKQIGDGWTGDNITWEVTNARLEKSKDLITIRSDVLWKSASGSGAQLPIVKEDLRITVHASTPGYRVIDYDFRLAALVDSLKIGGSDDEKGYGGFSLRLKLPKDIRFIANEGEVQPQVLSVDAGPWMNFRGSFDGYDSAASGVVVLCHPSNPGSPEQWILRKENSMQNPAFPGRVPVALDKAGLSFRYRMILYKDLVDEKLIREMFERYSAL